MFRQAIAFLKKDFLVESSYKLSFLMNVFGVLASVLVYFFIDKLFGHKIVGHLEEFGTDYFSYVLLGMAFFSYVGTGLGSFADRLRLEQMQGTLEAVLLTPIKTRTLLFSMSLWNIFMATLDMIIYIALGMFFFKVDFSRVNIFSAFVVLILSVSSFSALGILSASFIMVFKRGNPVGWVVSSLEGLIGGVYFPVSILPAWGQVIARFFPITYAIRACELAVYKGYSVFQLVQEITYLLLFSLLLIPLSVCAFNYAIHKAKIDGSLGQY